MTISRGMVRVMAVGCGVAVANLYYNQPLLAEIGREFGARASEVSSIPTLTQLGYAIGLLSFVPLGDSLNRRRLILLLLGAVAVALAAAALAPSIPLLAAASLAIGITTVIPQLLVPFAAQLAPPAERGQVVGTVMSGLLLGVLLARTFSGFVGQHFGWRAVFWSAAALSLALAAVLARALPRTGAVNAISYPDLMRSLGRLLRKERRLHEAALIGAALFAAFSAFWTTLAFLLATPPYHYGPQAAGLFSLIGAAGASAAPAAGGLADRKGPRFVVGIGIALSLVSFGLFWVAGRTLLGLIAGVLLLDLGVQVTAVSNLARIYRIAPGSESRVNTLYMVAYFSGASAGSLAGAQAWARWNWPGVCALGVILVAAALAVHVFWRSEAAPLTAPVRPRR